MNLVLSSASGIFPGAESVAALWQRVLRAEPADTAAMAAYWGIPRERYHGPPGQADAICQDAAFLLPPAWLQAPAGLDRQVWLGQAVLNDLRASAGELPPRTGLVLATSWTGEAFYRHEAARRLGLAAPLAPALDPAAQLAAVAVGLQGPRLALDTACASSLYALLQAASLIRLGRAEACVVMGLNAYLPPFLFAGFSRLGALSVAAASRPYLAGADGIVLGEAVAALLLEPEATALTAGRRPLAYLWGGARSADGADRGVFAPGPRGLAQVLRRAWDGWPEGLAPAYVEGHGTGTPTGDATELAALQAQFPRPLALGSVKGLVGHTLAAAGLVSLIKVGRALQEGVIPPHLAGAPHPALASTELYLPEQPQPWPEGPAGRLGAVSALGFGGANAHLILGDRPPPRRRPQVAVTGQRPALAIVDAVLRVGGEQGRAALSAAAARLPDRLRVDARGLRLGPAMLARIEPFQLLTSALAAELAARHPRLDRSGGQAIFLTNLGGAMSLRSAARLQYLWQDPAPRLERAAELGPAITPEAIASSLPSLCSGYAAFHLDWQGGHQTVSGGAGSFWELLAEQVLAEQTAPVLLGAGCHRYSDQLPAATPELAGWLLLERVAADVPVLARVRAAACHPAAAEATFWDAAGCSADACQRLEVEAVGDPAAGTEAAGLVPLLRAIDRCERLLYVRVPLAGDQVLSLLLERGERGWAAPAPPQRPLLLRLRADPAGTAAAAMSGASDTATAADSAGAANATVARIRAHLAATTPVLERYLALRRRARTLLAPAAAAPPPLRQPQHRVLGAVAVAAEGLSAELRVDETQPYFFDHPLDHVPGILLLEAMLQAVEVWQRARGGDGLVHVSELSLRFFRFCEKRPAQVRLQAEGDGTLRLGVWQDGRRLCQARCRAEWAAPAGSAAAALALGPRAPREVLHKQRAENVLVGALQETADGFACPLLPPPPGHLLADGDPAGWTPLYWLETTRQFFMLLAHGPSGVPLGLPMSLVGLELRLPRPVPRGPQLTLHNLGAVEAYSGGNDFKRLQCQLRDADGVLGELQVQAMVMDAASYRRQRGGRG